MGPGVMSVKIAGDVFDSPVNSVTNKSDTTGLDGSQNDKMLLNNFRKINIFTRKDNDNADHNTQTRNQNHSCAHTSRALGVSHLPAGDCLG